jgi:O-antigen ligase
VAAVLGTTVFVVAQPRRWPAVGAAVAGALGSATAVVLLSTRHALVNGPLGSDAARRAGWEAAIAIAIVCGATAAAFEFVAPRLPAPGRGARRVCLAAVAVVVVAGVAAAASRFHDFTRTPTASGTVGGHLVSGGGSGRWQFWTAAVHEFESSWFHGRGAGSFANWWNQHASFTYTVRNAHSLYLETLGELGIVGFALLVGALGAGVAIGVRRLRRARGYERTATAALLGVLAAYLLAAGIDWMWELTAITLVGVVVLGLLAGEGGPVPRPHRALGAALAVIAAAILVAEAIPLLADIEVRRSQAEARSGNLARARAHAVAATRLEPWAASPYLQLALVEAKANRLVDAATAIHRATSRDADDWQPWYVAAGIEGRLGDGATARRSLIRARALDPRSRLFSETP